MSARLDYITFFKDIDKGDISVVGGKGANLGEMVKADFPVPPGFAVTVSAYDLFLKENDLSAKISEILKSTDVNQPDQLNFASQKIEGIITSSPVPNDISREIINAYKTLSGKFKSAFVAVRSSATAEDLPSASFAGQQATFLNIKGESSLLVAVRSCWASPFTPRAIFYRTENKIFHEKVKISVIVQKMIQSEVSGVMFTIEPVTNQKDRIVIEAIWGLGEMIVQGSVVPDRYVIQKNTFGILSKEISDQSIQLVKKGFKNKEIDVPKKIREKQKLSDEEIIKLAKIADRLQKHYFFPQDIEWAREGKDLFIVQTRPVTTTGSLKISSSQKLEQDGILKIDGVILAETPFMKGVGASPGIGTGPVRILRDPKEINKIRSGDVLVAKMTSPDYVPAMKKAVAIVTDEGGQTSHAAIVSRELGIPCVVGTKGATQKLKNEMVVSVDGANGNIYLGGKVKIEKKKEEKKDLLKLKTATKVYVNLAEKELAKKISRQNVEGVGLLRAEFMIASIAQHPKEAIKQKKQSLFIEKLTQNIKVFCQAFYPRPVVYRATDFKTNEYRSLPGGKSWEPEEANPMLGYRGAFRYISDPEVFNLELQAIKNVRKKYNNLWLMIPFVRSPEELIKVRRLVVAEGLFGETSFKFWMMVEIPINVILIDEFIKVGIDGVSIGSNDLTMLITGTDRDNASVAGSFNEMSPAVLWSIKKVVKHCNRGKVSSSICGQAPSEYPDLVKKLVDWGITSISVNPDAIVSTREVIYRAEKELAGFKKKN